MFVNCYRPAKYWFDLSISAKSYVDFQLGIKHLFNIESIFYRQNVGYIHISIFLFFAWFFSRHCIVYLPSKHKYMHVEAFRYLSVTKVNLHIGKNIFYIRKKTSCFFYAILNYKKNIYLALTAAGCAFYQNIKDPFEK